MKLLQNSWSDLLVLDHLYQRMHYQLPDEIQLANGQKFDLLSLALLGTSSEIDALNQVQSRLMALKLDSLEYLCLKFLLLLSPGKVDTPLTVSLSAACNSGRGVLVSRTQTANPPVLSLSLSPFLNRGCRRT